nr:unnamed protein product [Callosobruchus chinensis]
MWKILCAGSAGRQLKLRNTSSSIVLPCAEEEARIWKLSRRREDRNPAEEATEQSVDQEDDDDLDLDLDGVNIDENIDTSTYENGFFSSFHNINAGVPQGSVWAPTLFLLHINDLLSSTTHPIHSFLDDSTLHSGVMSNRPISVVELEPRRLATTAALSKDLETITAWGLKNMVEFNASKTQYCTLSKKRCPSEHSVLMNNQALPRSHSLKLLGISITENMIWHEHVWSIATAAGKKLGYQSKAWKYFSLLSYIKHR